MKSWEAQRLGIVAEILKMPDEQVFGGFFPEVPGGGRWDGAIVERVEVAPGWKHIKPAPRRRARWAGGYAFAIEASEQSADFVGSAGGESRADFGFDLVEHQRTVIPAKAGIPVRMRFGLSPE